MGGFYEAESNSTSVHIALAGNSRDHTHFFGRLED